MPKTVDVKPTWSDWQHTGTTGIYLWILRWKYLFLWFRHVYHHCCDLSSEDNDVIHNMGSDSSSCQQSLLFHCQNRILKTLFFLFPYLQDLSGPYRPPHQEQTSVRVIEQDGPDKKPSHSQNQSQLVTADTTCRFRYLSSELVKTRTALRSCWLDVLNTAICRGAGANQSVLLPIW